MEIKHVGVGGMELLFSSFDSPDVWHELNLLQPILKKPIDTDAAIDCDGNSMKNNRGVFFDKVYAPIYAACSPTSCALEKFIDASASGNFMANSPFQALYTIQGFNVLFSAYRDGDYYKPHRDGSKLTALLWVGENDFDGGDLFFPDFDYTIPYEQNKLIMFPSYYQHEVTPISTDKEGFVRYCASAFIN